MRAFARIGWPRNPAVDRPGLAAALSHARVGDCLIVSKLDRLRRGLRSLLDFIARLRARGVGFRSLGDAIDTTAPQGRFFFAIVGAFAAMVSELIRERTNSGLAAARVRGRKGGRPRKLTSSTMPVHSSPPGTSVPAICGTRAGGSGTIRTWGRAALASLRQLAPGLPAVRSAPPRELARIDRHGCVSRSRRHGLGTRGPVSWLTVGSPHLENWCWARQGCVILANVHLTISLDFCYSSEVMELRIREASSIPGIPLRVAWRRIDDLKRDPKNPSSHSRHQIRQLAKSIAAFGFNVPVLIGPGSKIIAGQARLLAAQELGWDEVPTILLGDLSAAQARAFMIAGDRLAETPSWDDLLLAMRLKELSPTDLGAAAPRRRPRTHRLRNRHTSSEQPPSSNGANS